MFSINSLSGFNFITRDVWLSYSQPTNFRFTEVSNIPSSIEVRIDKIFILLQCISCWYAIMKELTDTQKAYIAGIIDGEGCISMSKIKSRNSTSIRARIMIANANTLLLDWLYEVTGIGAIHEHCNDRNNKRGWKKQRIWTIYTKQGVELLRAILPYLIIKQRQAKLFIELHDIQKKSSRALKFNEVRQEEILKEIHELNWRGNTVCS